MAVAYTDITRDGVAVEDLFPPARVTVAEIHGTVTPSDSSAGITPVVPAEDTAPSGDGESVPSPEEVTPECLGCGQQVVHEPAACPGAPELDPRLEESTDQ